MTVSSLKKQQLKFFQSHSGSAGEPSIAYKQYFSQRKHSPKILHSAGLTALAGAEIGILSQICSAGSFVNGLGQSLQEALMQLIPRAGAGVVIRKTPLIAFDEAILEISQYLFSFIMPTMLGAALAVPLAKSFKIPHFELLGKPSYLLNQSLNKEIEIGQGVKQKVPLNPQLLGQISLAKLSLFAMLAAYSFAMEFVSSGLKVLAMNKLFGTSDFYTISGLNEKTAENSDDGQHAIDAAWKNIKRVACFLPMVMLGIFGLTTQMSRNKALANSKFVNSAARLFDLSDRFGLPKTLLAVSVLTAGFFAYPSVARNEAESLEVKHRVLYFAAPTVLFFKQLVGNLLALIYGHSRGLGNVLAPVSSYFSEVKEGKRNIFDLGLLDLEKNKDGQFHGSVLQMKVLQKLKASNLPEYERVAKTMHFMGHGAPYLMALVVGILVNWLNYLNTADLHKQETLQPVSN